MKVKKRMVVLVVISMVIQLISLPAFADTDSTNLAEVGFIGPGKYVADILMIDGGISKDTDVVIGQMSLWNTRDRLWMTLDTDQEWAIREVMIYVGADEVPITLGGAPAIQEFPYKAQLTESTHTYEFSLDLMDDLDLTWGKRDEARRIPKISVCLHVEPTSETSTQGMGYAWGQGNVEFLNHTGWWMNYAIVHPSTGHFIDAPVKGVGYQTPTHIGITDDGGSFDYFAGESVELFIGGVSLGKVKADQRITPMDVVGTSDTDDPRVVNMAKLLQSLDEDGEPTGGIVIDMATSMALTRTTNEMEIDAFDFSDSDQIENVIEGTNKKMGGKLNPVDSVDALDNLQKGTSSNMVRKNVSKNSAFEDAKAKLELMPMYVPAMKANGDPVTLNYYDLVFDEEAQENEYELSEQRNLAKPLIACYAEKVMGTNGFDIYGAVSKDAGETWQVQNLSKSADKSSFMTVDGIEFSGTCHKPQIRVRGNYILAAWTSKFGRTGNPRYALEPDEPYYEDDLFGVGGPQRSRDYSSDGYYEVGELPFSVVWTCRGVIDPATGQLTWYKPERLTSGRRDAFQLMQSGTEGAGFGVVWQEDPEGLRPGEMAGPGEGWSGATTNHKTDIWYSYIAWDDFKDIDVNFESSGVQKEDINEDQKGRPKAEIPFSMPVRISDNDTINTESMKIDELMIPGLDTLSEGDLLSVNSSNFVPLLEAGDDQGTHKYGYANLPSYYNGPAICDQLYFKVNHQEADKYVAVTEDGRILDGNTGASRPNIMMQPYMTKDANGKSYKSAWVVVCYEETKGAGAGPDEVTSASYDEHTPTDIESGTTDEGVPVDDETAPVDELTEVGVDPVIAEGSGVGEQKGKEAYVPDNGKLVIYHTFDMAKPDLVSAGEIMNPQVEIDSQADFDHYVWEDGSLPGLIPSKGNVDAKKGDVHRGLLYLVDEAGELLLDFNKDPIPAYENARRPRLLIQGANGALGKSSTSSPAKWDTGTSLVMVYKMGENGMGRPSDILMRRWEIPSTIKGSRNPYSTEFLSDEIYNISATRPTEEAININSSEDKSGDGIKVMRWEQPEEALMDATYANPYEDARAHRGILRGKKLAIAYDHTPNWAASRNGNDVYNLYLRRSFDGGETFTTNPNGNNDVYIDGVFQGIGVLHQDLYRTALGTGNERIDDDEIPKVVVETYWAKGEYEPAQNLSKLQNNKETVIEPRLVGGPSSTKVNGKVVYGEDQRNINLFWVTYGTSSNPGDDSMEAKVPLDLYYSYTDDFGDSFYHEAKIVNETSQGHYAGQERDVWPWLAKDTGKLESAQAECQIRMSPDGTVMYSVWNENGNSGGDVKFRRIMMDGKMIESDIDMVDVTAPFITISGIEDGDVRSEDVSIGISLNELGSWEATVSEGTNEDVYTTSPIEIAASTTPKAYVLDVVATDLSDNTSFRHIAFTIDGNVPQIDITGVVNGEHSNDDVHLEIHTFDAVPTIELLWNGFIMPAKSVYDLDAEGEYDLTVRAELDGKTSEKHIGFVIDKTAPTIRIEGVEDGETYVNSADPHVTVTDSLSDYLNELTMLMNGNEYLNSTKISEGGEYTLEIIAIDKADNRAEASVTFNVEVIGTHYRLQAIAPETVEGVIHVGKGATILFKNDFATLQVPVGEFDEDVSYIIAPATGETSSGRSLKVGDLTYNIEFFDKDGQRIDSFDIPMTLTFAYNDEDLPVGNLESELRICYRNDQLGEWIVIPGTSDRVNNLITAKISHLSTFGVRAVKAFPDLADCGNHWAANHIYRLASLGIVCGDDQGNYKPEELITREELAKILVNTIDLASDGQMVAADEDAISDWAKEFMRIAVATGALKADGNGNVNPQRYATRQELIAAAKAVFGLKVLNVKPVAFSDLETLPRELHQAAQVMSQHGILNGYEDGSIRPDGSITRGELAKMISQFLLAERQ
ncbi:hypothetical protein SANA_12820 [Gottschalkiaceae bacterium SANA]|nr:hypothetical protein SANA_12820 [Gottschalkiaceae bacterium SANA]